MSDQTTKKRLNPTYPGCSAVIGRPSGRLLRHDGNPGLNPTYPGCSAVIRCPKSFSAQGSRQVLILLTLDAAL